MTLSTECPAGGRHEIVHVVIHAPDPKVLEVTGNAHRIPGRICRKCWLRDTYIEEE